MLIEAIDTWLERKLYSTKLTVKPLFSIMADECEDISSQEELSICFRWLVNGSPEDHFLTILHIKAMDAESITNSLTSFISQKSLDYTGNWWVKGMTEQQLSLAAKMVSKEGLECMQLMPFMFTAHAIDCK